jgi:hypothetical protein
MQNTYLGRKDEHIPRMVEFFVVEDQLATHDTSGHVNGQTSRGIHEQQSFMSTTTNSGLHELANAHDRNLIWLD